MGVRQWALGLALAAFLCPGLAAAQAPVVTPAPPPAAAPTAEQLEAQFDPGIQPVQPADEVGIDETDEAPVPLDEASTYAFTLRGVDVANATVYDDDDFRDIYGSFLDTEVTIGGLREISNRIEQRYRDDGYVATRVIIPPQAIADGVARLEVFEGKIIHYEINGEIGEVKKQIARLLDNLLTDEPATWRELERYLLLSRDLPGISLTGTLRSAGESAPGGVILVVDAARKPVDGFVSLQNRNAEPTGTFTASAGLALNSNTQYAERIGGVALLALELPEQVSGFLSYEQSIGNDGLRFEVQAIHGFSEPGDELAPLVLVSNTTILSAELEYPVVRSRRFSLWTRGGFDYEDQRVSVGKPGQELADEQLRVIYAGARMIALPPLGGITQFDVEFRQGLEDFGAAVAPDDDANVDFSIARGEFSHRQPVPPFFELFAGARGQLASEELPSIEEMSLGELTVGRGFEPGALTGDSGFGLVGELRYFPPGIDPWWLDDISFFGFVDYGRAYDFGNPTANPKGYEDLSSWGFGTRFQAFETVFGEFYYAQPMTDALSISPRKPDGGVKFTLTKFF